MRLTPTQIGVRLISGVLLPPSDSGSLADRIREGHDFLVKLTGRDFGYDLRAWHDHLKESHRGSYTFRNVELPSVMRAALESPDWQAAVVSLTEQGT